MKILKRCLWCMAALFLLTAGCSRAAPRVSVPPAGLNASAMAAQLSAFIGERGEGFFDRTAFSAGETAAAHHIAELLLSGGIESEIMEADCRYDEGVFKTQNVVAVYNAGRERSVVIAAHYDNQYGGNERLGVPGSYSAGVLNNGTGVALLISLAQYVAAERPELGFTLVFAFIGGGSVGMGGSESLLRDVFKSRADTVLCMINLRRMAGKRIYVYADEVKTEHGALLLSAASGYKTAIVPMPKGVPLYPVPVSPRLSYSHEGLNGMHLPFFNAGIRTLNLFGGEPFGLFFGAAERPDSPASFALRHEGFDDDMADTASALYAFLTDPKLAGTAQEAIAGYGWLQRPNAASAAALLLIAVCGVALILLTRRLDREDTTRRNGRSHRGDVFGEEYEDSEK